jgi:hypothetical protein
MTFERIYLTDGPAPEKQPEAKPAPYIPAEEDIIADGSAGAFEATEVVSEEDLHPLRHDHQKKGKDYY